MTDLQRLNDITQRLETIRTELVEIDDIAFRDALVLLGQAERLVNEAKVHFEDHRTACDMLEEAEQREQLAKLRNPAYDGPDGIFTDMEET
jgi:hypothetical protein